jgi:hypothetical protein
VLQAALQAAWAEILVETASSFHGLDSPSKAALRHIKITLPTFEYLTFHLNTQTVSQNLSTYSDKDKLTQTR